MSGEALTSTTAAISCVRSCAIRTRISITSFYHYRRYDKGEWHESKVLEYSFYRSATFVVQLTVGFLEADPQSQGFAFLDISTTILICFYCFLDCANGLCIITQ